MDHVLTSGEGLRAVREQHGLTQAQVAEAMGTSRPYVTVLEGKSLIRSTKTIERYVAAVQTLTKGGAS